MTPRPRTLSLREEMRIFLGLLIQPIVAAVLGFITFPLLEWSHPLLQSDVSVSGSIQPAIAEGIAVSMAASLVTLLAAFPAAVWVLKRYQFTLGRAVMSGLVLGNLIPAIAIVLCASYGLLGLVRLIVFGSLLGVAGAVAFWMVWVRTGSVETALQAD
jgi:flagellar biogenesis protein FliO